MILTSDFSAMFLSIFHAYYLGRLEREFYKMFLYTSSYDRKIIVISVIAILLSLWSTDFVHKNIYLLCVVTLSTIMKFCSGKKNLQCGHIEKLG